MKDSCSVATYAVPYVSSSCYNTSQMANCNLQTAASKCSLFMPHLPSPSGSCVCECHTWKSLVVVTISEISGHNSYLTNELHANQLEYIHMNTNLHYNFEVHVHSSGAAVLCLYNIYIYVQHVVEYEIRWESDGVM